MTILSSILLWLFSSALGKAILKIIWDDLSEVMTEHMAKNKIKADAEASVKPLKDAPANDGKAIDSASDSAIGGV